MPKIKVDISNRQKQRKIPTGVRLLIKKCCNAVLLHQDFEEPTEVSVSFTDNVGIQELNASYRNKDIATDVLSFPLGQDGVYDRNPQTGNLMLGDIVISVEKAFEQAETYGHSYEREMGFLTVHSMLHLLGYDHENGGIEATNMREIEEQVLRGLGLARETSFFGDGQQF